MVHALEVSVPGEGHKDVAAEQQTDTGENRVHRVLLENPAHFIPEPRVFIRGAGGYF
jgi:hypothetical protein